MGKLYTFILFLFVGNSCFSQLTVKPASPAKSSYIYVKENVFYVHGPIALHKNSGTNETEASIYLREESQLIQGSQGISQNTGNGLLSVFQEGTSNAYDYNYWSSPVGTDLLGNGLFGIDMLYAPETKTKSSRAGSMNALDGSANPLLISRRWIYTFSGTKYSDWKHVGNHTEIPAGVGFTMKGVNGKDLTTVNGRANNPGNQQRYDFRGKPNNGEITIPVSEGAKVLIGNPYPSALDLSLFLLENSGTGTLQSNCYNTIIRKNAITGIAYFWDSMENGTSHYLHEYVGGYGAFSPVDPCTAGIYVKPVFKKYGVAQQPSNLPSSSHYDRRFSPIGQGFMVEGATTTTVDFKNSHRIFKKEGELSEFKSSEIKAGETEKLTAIPKIRLEATVNNQYTREFTLGFWVHATSGTDLGMDAKAYEVVPTDIGFLQNSENYVIDLRPFEKEDEIPLFLKVKESTGNIKIRILELENFDTENIFIFDSELQNYHSIKEAAFEADLEPGNYHGRFQIAFVNKTKTLLEDKVIEKEPLIFQNNKKGQLEISNSTSSPVVSISLFDLSGKKIFSRKISEKEDFHSFATGHLSNSIYLVKILHRDGTVKTQKIAVQNYH